MKKSKLIYYFSLLFVFSINSYSQTKFVATNDIFGSRVFIKNNGQFDKILPTNSIIDYVYSKGDEQVFFNKQGVTYFLQKRYPLSHSQFEAIEHGKKVTPKPSKKAFVNVSWENSNPNVELIVSDKQSYYHSFGDEKYKSDCYKKITYKNIYNNIDIEYLFTDERADGIKYNVIVHPGGNVNDIKIKYSGDVKKIILKKGNVIIKTPVIDITEFAPISYQDKKKIESSFKINDNLISFNVPNYDYSKELKIDPWVVNIAFATNNYAFDVDYDYAGNLYVYGGIGPFLISKYSPSGVLIWTFNGTVPSVSWTSIPFSNYAGNFIVDKFSGKIYTGQGYVSSGTRIVRLTTNGLYDNFISTADSNWLEIWDMGFRCNDNAIIGMGGGIFSNVTAGILNTNTGVINAQNFSGLPGVAQDIVSHTIDSNGNFFIILASVIGTPILNNKMLRINTTFNGNDWIKPSNYSSFDEGNNKLYPFAQISTRSNGYNALTANSSYLYYYDGFNLAVYNKLTGDQIAFTTITGQTAKQQGGIAVDECNNVYVGGIGFVMCFNFNGTTFTPNGTIPVATITTNKYVTDINLKVNELYVCGNSFAGVYSAINSLSCSSNASVSISQTIISTNNSTAIATVTTSVTNPLISYTWLDSSNTIISQTNNSSSLTNTVLNLTNGTYTVLVQLDAPCGLTTTQTFTINTTAIVTPLFTQVAAICSGASLAALSTTSTNGITGVWSPALNNTQTTTYTFTPTAGQNATTTTMTIIVNPALIPTFNSVAPICSGDVLSALPTTSINSITGTWLPALNNTQTTTYTFTPTTGNCVTTALLTIIVNQKVTPTFATINPICWGEIAPLLPNTSQNGITGTWQPSVVSNTLSGNYIFTPTLGQCFNLPPPVNVTVFDSFDFEITKACIDKNFILQVVPLLNSFDSASASYTWKNSNNTVVGINSSSFNVTNYLISNSIIPQLPITFSVEVQLPNGCKLSHSILIDKLYCDIQKGISPNGDNLNDFFDLQLLDVKKLSIFNRYGVKVYSKLDYTKEWVGQSDSGKELPDGTYYYVIEFNIDKQSATGWIYINRER